MPKATTRKAMLAWVFLERKYTNKERIRFIANAEKTRKFRTSTPFMLETFGGDVNYATSFRGGGGSKTGLPKLCGSATPAK